MSEVARMKIPRGLTVLGLSLISWAVVIAVILLIVAL